MGLIKFCFRVAGVNCFDFSGSISSVIRMLFFSKVSGLFSKNISTCKNKW